MRVERLQEIALPENVEDIFSEGLCKANYYQDTGYPDYETCDIDTDEALEDFKDLWDSINAKRGWGWEVNPWVWVVEFRKMPTTNGKRINE